MVKISAEPGVKGSVSYLRSFAIDKHITENIFTMPPSNQSCQRHQRANSFVTMAAAAGQEVTWGQLTAEEQEILDKQIAEIEAEHDIDEDG